jgi:transcriptional regulator with XRE-family HTH domain
MAALDKGYPQAPTNDTLEGDTFGRVLQLLRERALFSQRELIEEAGGESEVGLSVAALSHWERDRRVPSPSHLLLLVRTLDVTGPDFLALLETAAQVEPHYAQSALLVREGRWDRKDWEVWASSFPQRSARKTRGE